MARIEIRISEDGSTVALHAFHEPGEVVSPGPHGLDVDRTHTCIVSGTSRVEWPDGRTELFTPESDCTEINRAQRDQDHREVAVTAVETCCWLIPRTAATLLTTGFSEGLRLGILRAEPGQVLRSVVDASDAEEDA